MELREMRAFVVLAEQLHFGRAARLLHVSQPALTKQIHRLEKELGGSLCTRGRGGVHLTDAGRRFLSGARVLLTQCDELLAHTRQAAQGEIGRLRIGFGFHTAELVPRLLVRLRRSMPTVEISLRDMSTVEQIEGLCADQIDLGFVRLPVRNSQLETFPVSEDRLMLLAGSSLRLPAPLSLAACRDLPFVLISRERSPSMRQHVLELCGKHGFHPRIVQEVSEATTVLALVRAGMGISLFSQSMSVTRTSGVLFHHIAEPAAAWSVGAAWRKGDRNPVLRRFLDMIKPEARRRKKPARCRPENLGGEDDKQPDRP